MWAYTLTYVHAEKYGWPMWVNVSCISVVWKPHMLSCLTVYSTSIPCACIQCITVNWESWVLRIESALKRMTWKSRSWPISRKRCVTQLTHLDILSLAMDFGEAKVSSMQWRPTAHVLYAQTKALWSNPAVLWPIDVRGVKRSSTECEAGSSEKPIVPQRSHKHVDKIEKQRIYCENHKDIFSNKQLRC